MIVETLLNKHQKYLTKLPKISQSIQNIKTLYSPKEFCKTLIKNIQTAKNRICIVTLYLDKDKGGSRILNELYKAKENNPLIEILVLVDWHRAHRNRIGNTDNSNTNVDWYIHMSKIHPDIDIPIYGVPINKREALGVLHLKGFIIDANVIYSGANLNSTYLHQEKKYRYDRYQIIYNQLLADTLINYISKYLLTNPSVIRLNDSNKLENIKIKNKIRSFRKILRKSEYHYRGNANLNELSVVPLIGFGKKSLLNETIHHLLCSTRKNLKLCTPYFNLPKILLQDISKLLNLGKNIEIIVGDKTANDFYIPDNQPFKIIGTLPYLYEVNLRKFIRKFQNYIDNGQLIIRLWKNGENSYHLKGLWIDDNWQMITGNNFNSRAWKLDLENALLIHDPKCKLSFQKEQELNKIRTHTRIVYHFTEIQKIVDYPKEINKVIRRILGMRADYLINKIS